MWNNTNTTEQLVKGILRHGPDILEHCVCSESIDKYIQQIEKEFLDYPIPKKDFNPKNWFMPDSYKNMDIEEYLVNICPKENYQRLVGELEE